MARGDRGVVLALALIALAGMLAYANSLSGPFVFDDLLSIPQNPTIRSLWPLSKPLSPNFLDGRTVDWRPLLNLSFAICYAIGGTQVWVYHFGNTVIHILAGGTLFGILRRTFARPALRGAVGEAALPLAAAAAVLWVVHPLQTEAVTYIVQRAESLAGLFYLLTLYAFLRGEEATRRQWGWFGASVTACLAGIATKETLVTAPILVLLYDRTFLAGTFRQAWRRRWKIHAALFLTWVPLAWVMAASGSRGGTAGFGTAMSPWDYALTQCRAVPHYLQLAVWPDPLVFDYGYGLIHDPLAVLPHALFLAALGAITFYALWRHPVAGFALCWVFLILAPTSTFVPSTMQVVAERRMYLPLAGLLAAGMLGIRWLAGRCSLAILGAIAIEWTAFTIVRNGDYRTAESLWSDTVNKWPASARAQSSLGLVFMDQHRDEEAKERFEAAVRIDPKHVAYRNNLGLAWLHLREPARAETVFHDALELAPGNAEAHCNLGSVLLVTGRREEAVAEFQEALRLNPENAQAHSNYGIALMREGRRSEALAHFEKAVTCDPSYAEGRNNLGMALAALGRMSEARVQFQESLRLSPNYEQAKSNLKRFEKSADFAPP